MVKIALKEAIDHNSQEDLGRSERSESGPRRLRGTNPAQVYFRTILDVLKQAQYVNQA